MPTLVRDPQPAEFEALLDRRRRLGQDLFDEVWEGVLHINPAPSGRHARIEAQLLGLERAEYKHLERSRAIELGGAELEQRLDWR
jgi:hypothetical protein